MTARFAPRDDSKGSREHEGEAQPVEDVRSVVQLEPGAPVSQESFAEEVLERLARAGRFRDEETAEHVERMSRSCGLIARALGWDAGECNKLRAASAMHDIGKVGVPDAILRKPGRLDSAERVLVQAHAQIGHDILSGSNDDVLILAATIALTHHEAWDGTGYPRRLAGEEIPLPGRIAAVADVFDALTHDRVYRRAHGVEETVRRLRAESGTHFDPDVVVAFEEVLPEIDQVRQLYPDDGRGGEDVAALFAGPERPIRVLIAEETPAIADDVELLLRREKMEVADRVRSVESAHSVLRSQPVDIVVLNPALEGGRGSEVIEIAKRCGAAVLLCEEISGAEAAPDAHAVAASESPAEFVAAVKALARGEKPAESRDAKASPDRGTLTTREKEVTQLLATGLTGEEIAGRLFLSSETVRTHVRNAMQRMNAKTRAHLIALAANQGEISLDEAEKPPV